MSFTADISTVLWALIIGIILALFLGAGMGANDVSNAFGTSVGSGVLSIVQAYILASIFETLGSVLVGWSVTDTMRKGVIDTSQYTSNPKELLLGQVAILGVLSWFLSPALSGCISIILYMIVDITVLRQQKPFECGLKALPIFYFFCIAFNILMVTWDGSKLLQFNNIPIWGALLISTGSGLIAALVVNFVLRPRILRKIQASPDDMKVQNYQSSINSYSKTFSVEINSGNSGDLEGKTNITNFRLFLKWLLPDATRKEDAMTTRLFSTIQICTACFAGFAHGANDVSNAVAPLAALVSIYKEKNAKQESEVGKLSISNTSLINYFLFACAGFTIEFGAAMTALLASKLGIPISTTHCLVGSVVAVGSIKSTEGIKWSIFRNIIISWVVTVPVAEIKKVEMEIPVMGEPLASPSPELGMENIEDHSRISPEHAPPKKEDAEYLLGVVESLRGIYESKHEEVDIVNSMKQLKITFNRAIKANSERPKRVFFDELGFRLDFMMESTAYLDARLRVLKMVSKLAIIIQRDANNVEFIDFLVNYCEELCFCDEAAVRQNVCSLIGFLFSASSSFAKDTNHVMSFNYRKRLYVLIRKRQLDKIVNVRAEVIRAVLAIQDDEIASDFKEALERSPKDIILMGLRDIAFECRLAAVQSLSVAVHAQLEGLIDLAMGDKYSRVRIGAICRLGKLPLRLFTAEQKINLLYATLSDADQTIREAGHKLLLSEWLDSILNLRMKKSKKSNTLEQYVKLDLDYGLGTAAQTLLGQLDFAESYETRKSARIILFASFDIIRKRLSLENEMLSDFVTALVNDRTKPEIISRSNYKIILNRKLSTVNQACYTFFWHSLVKYCSEKAKNEPDKLECMHRLAVTLSAMCGVVKK
uniref:Phosphate transporter n=1 Tax=Heterorhabditis bacteriophora TaxID=37862 RepID=A0A1I7WYU3_HETBA